MKNFLAMVWLIVVALGCGDASSETPNPDAETKIDLNSDAGSTDAASEDGGVMVSPTFAAVYAILSASCGGELCHIEQTAGGLGMRDAESAYQALLHERGACEVDRVVPNDPEASLLIQKLEGMPECKNPMPLLQDKLPAGDIQTIRDWIENGALED